MPKTINGKKLTDSEHMQWKKIYQETGNAAIATSAIQKKRNNKLKNLK